MRGMGLMLRTPMFFLLLPLSCPWLVAVGTFLLAFSFPSVSYDGS